MKKQLTVLLVAATLAPQPAFIAQTTTSAVAHAAEKAIKPKLRFSESFRKESFVRSEETGNATTTETHEAARGTLKLSIELPYSREKSAAFDVATPVSVKLGGFEFGSTLGSDPQFAPGKTTATLILAANSPSGNSRVILATAVVKWEKDKDKLTIKIDADTPAGGKPVAAEDFLASLAGKVNAETTAQVQVGNQKTDIAVPFTGKVTRKTAGGPGATGVVVTVDLKN